MLARKAILLEGLVSAGPDDASGMRQLPGPACAREPRVKKKRQSKACSHVSRRTDVVVHVVTPPPHPSASQLTLHDGSVRAFPRSPNMTLQRLVRCMERFNHIGMQKVPRLARTSTNGMQQHPVNKVHTKATIPNPTFVSETVS